ncbi:hypothetical protein PS898_05215 [Pseudomonas fluorescens]|nr:hypothetical protein PS898_05215 [Pseudomonas fluorescens]
MHAIELARCAFEYTFAFGIEGDGRRFAAIHRHHIDHDIAQRDVVDRFELALDHHQSALRALDDTGEEFVVAAADGGTVFTEADQPLHAYQRGQISGVADGIGGAAGPMLELFAVKTEGVWKAVECLLDAGDGFHQRTRLCEMN